MTFDTRKTRMVWLSDREKIWGYDYLFWRIHERERQQDRHCAMAQGVLKHSITRQWNWHHHVFGTNIV